MLLRKSQVVKWITLIGFLGFIGVFWLSLNRDSASTVQQIPNKMVETLDNPSKRMTSANFDIRNEKSSESTDSKALLPQQQKIESFEKLAEEKNKSDTGVHVHSMMHGNSDADASNDEMLPTNLTPEQIQHIKEHRIAVNISKKELQLTLEKDVINPHNFNYIINNPDICSDAKVFMLIYVHTAPDHFRRRDVIRETWGNTANFKNFEIRLIFLLGQTDKEDIQKSLYLESNAYHDIIQEDFVDSYKNLTYKGILGLKWISTYCNHAKYVLKTDDDIFVNIYNLVPHLQSLRGHGIATRNTILCNVWNRMIVMRDKNSKWYVSKEEFAEDYYPTYCSGSAYLFTTDVIPKMYEASKKTKFFWVDDFYITGLLAQKSSAQHYNLNSLYVLNANTVVKDFTSGNNWTWVFGHIHGLDKMYYVWHKIASKFSKYFK